MLKFGKFNKSAEELLENSHENIYARDEKGLRQQYCNKPET
ncbi:hypothetical protein [Wolbachia endosymbiont (group B) of Agriphila straminella]|nr:hypothetical protein [Wolbachia endosymbiont (group B) of Agriphila straminella]